jgi:hypothetical protein
MELLHEGINLHCRFQHSGKRGICSKTTALSNTNTSSSAVFSSSDLVSVTVLTYEAYHFTVEMRKTTYTSALKLAHLPKLALI